MEARQQIVRYGFALNNLIIVPSKPTGGVFNRMVIDFPMEVYYENLMETVFEQRKPIIEKMIRELSNVEISEFVWIK